MDVSEENFLERVGIVIRAQGERTEGLCQSLAEDQVNKSMVFVVKEKPFKYN